MIAIDSSVAVKWTVRESDHLRALELLGADEERVAPDLLLPELERISSQGLARRESYIVAQMSRVPEGIEKLRTAASQFNRG